MVRPLNLENEKLTGIRGYAASFVESKRFTDFIAALILINAVTLGMETDKGIVSVYGSILHIVDFTILGIFVVELSIKLFAYRLSFFRAGWNLFDFGIIAVALIPASGAFSILRTLRILRILRMLSVVPSMRRVIAALLHSIPGMAAIIGVLTIIFYISAVLATQMFGHHPDPVIQKLFGNFPASMYTLFQVMTLEGWSENVAEPTMEFFPWAWIFFVPFIIVTSFAVLNLFIGIIVDAMDIVHSEEAEELMKTEKTSSNDNKSLEREVKALRRDIAALRKQIKK